MAGLAVTACPWASASTNLFTSGQGGYNTYRIPALYQTTNGTLLAFCEGRKNSSSDTGDIDTMLRRSFDAGTTWTTQRVVWSDAANTCGNPTVVQDRNTGRIWLFLTWNNGNDTQSEIQNHTSIDVRKIYSSYSDDDGATWTAPLNRFAEVQPADTRWDATGPGCGIQVVNGSHPGRLVIPANGRNIQSDDHGATWTQSADVPGGSSESQEVEISGGVLLRNDRASGSYAAYNARIFSRSTNQGASWGALEVRADLPCPICQASTIVVNHPAGLNGRMLVFSNPSATTRVNMTIQCSLDDGVTWPYSRQVYSGSSAYSCLTKLGTNGVGLLYERDSYGRITFDKFTLDQLVPYSQTQTWDGGGGAGNESWQQGNNWVSNTVPAFNNGLDVIFHSAGAGNLTNALGADCTLRSLTFTSGADSDIAIYLGESINSPVTNYTLTFDSGSGSATNTVTAGATGNITIGVGGSSGPGSVSLAANLVVNQNGSGELKIDRPISGAGGITKNGSGRLYLRQSNTYTGTTTINEGVVITGGNTGGFGASGSAGPLLVNGGTIANSTAAARPIYNSVTMGGDAVIGGVSGYGAGLLTFSGTFNFGGANRILTVNSPVTISGVASAGGLIKSGAETLTLSAANTYTGPTTIFTGIVQLGDGGTTGSLDGNGTVAIGPNGIFQFNRTANLSPFNSNLSGTGTLLKTNTGELGLTGTNSFSGTLDVEQGKLGLSGAACVNGAPRVIVAANGTLSVGSGFLGGTATIGNLSGSGRIDPIYGSGTAVRTLQVNQTTDGIFSGIIADGTSGRVLAFTKSGAATLTLSGNCSHTGATTVTNGTLLVTGAISNSIVTVMSGATLAGTGFIGSAVNVQAGGTLAPGTSLGTLTISNTLTLNPASTVFVELNASNGQRDRVVGLTSVTYAGSLIVSNLAGVVTNGQSFSLFGVVPSFSGNFSGITPPPAANLAWSFNPTNGTLSARAVVAAYPTNLACVVSNGALSLSWPATHLGWIAQSNVVGLQIPGNWYDIAGTSNLTSLNILPNRSVSNAWYRLRAP